MISILIGLALQNSPAIYTQFAEELHSANSVSARADVTVKTLYGLSRSRETYAFMRPNFWRVERREQKHMQSLTVGDGVNDWTYDAVENRLEKDKSPVGEFMETGFMMGPFLGGVDVPGIPDGKVAKVSFHGKEALQVELTPDGKAPTPAGRSTEVYMDLKSRVPVGMIVSVPSRKTSYQVQFENFKVNPPLTKADFHYEPTIAVDTTGVDESALLPVGAKAPGFSGIQMGGVPFDLQKEIKGSKAVVLNFWQTGCPPCRQELPELAKLEGEKRGQGLKVITVAVYNDEISVAAFAKRTGLTLPIVFSRSCQPDVVYAYKATSYPVSYLLSSDGKIAARYVGNNVDAIRADLAKLGL